MNLSFSVLPQLLGKDSTNLNDLVEDFDLFCYIYLQEPERQISPSPCTGHGIWFKHIGQEGKPAILGATHPCSSTKHIPAAKNLL
jgi:hypothetical protein